MRGEQGPRSQIAGEGVAERTQGQLLHDLGLAGPSHVGRVKRAFQMDQEPDQKMWGDERDQRWGRVSEHACSQSTGDNPGDNHGGMGPPPPCTEEQVQVPRRELLVPGAHRWGVVRLGLRPSSQNARTHAISIQTPSPSTS